MWDYMARRELELGSLKSPEPTTKQMKVSEMTQREERCSAVFEEAVTAVPTGEIFCLHFNISFSCYLSILCTARVLKEDASSFGFGIHLGDLFCVLLRLFSNVLLVLKELLKVFSVAYFY